MKIRITGHKLDKYQFKGEVTSTDFPKIGWTQPTNNEPTAEEAPAGYFDQKPIDYQSDITKSGIGPSFKTDATDDAYNQNAGFQKKYDYSLQNYHLQNPNKDSRNYSKFMKEKYGSGPSIGNIASLSGAITAGIGLGSAMTDYFEDQRKQKEYNQWMRSQQLSDNLNPAVAGSRGDYVNTGSGMGMFKPDQYVSNKGMFLKENGGEFNDNTMKIRIVAGPQQMAYGGQSGYGLDLGERDVDDVMMSDNSYDNVGNTLQPVSREHANIEAEKGETIYGDLDDDGAMEHMKVGGKRHVDGGTPLSVPEGSFVFSDTKKMAIKDPEVLKEFGLSPRAGGYTPATIAKRYDINKYKAIMEDPESDFISKQTAQLMVEKYNEKLAMLSMVQESMKGFPQGIPKVAEGQIPEEEMSEEEMAYGGNVPKAQFGIEWNPTSLFGARPTSFMPGPGPGIKASSGKTAAVAVSKNGKLPPINITEEEIFNPDVVSGLVKKGYTIKYSPRVAAGDTKVPTLQHKQNTGLYGDVKPQELEEFKNRHAWYFANRPNWNPANKNDVMDFQTKYDQEFARQKGFSYFSGKRKYSGKDGLLGEYTYNAPGLDMTPKAKQPAQGGWVCGEGGPKYVGPNDPLTGLEAYGFYATKEEAERVCAGASKEKVEPNQVVETQNEKMPFGFMAPDVMNMVTAAALPPKKYLPYMAKYNTVTAEPTFYDPNRELAANAEQANIQGQYLANFAGPQSFLANMSGVQGKAAENAANIMGKYNNLNVGVANDFAVRNADMKTKESLANTERANELYKGNVIANEQYRNAQRQYLNNFSKTFGTAWNNRMNLGLLNAVNPMYNIDPFSGRSYFKKGYNASKLSGTSGSPADSDYWGSVNAGYMAAKGKFPDLTPEQYLRSIGANTTSYDKNNDGIYDSRRSTGMDMFPFYNRIAFGGPVKGNR